MEYVNDALYPHIFNGLNDTQRAVINTTEGPLLVIAAAGSGKTRVLTHRVAYLLTQGVKPWEVLCITFTNKASNEMKERIHAMVGEDAHDIWMGTFHQICLRIIRSQREAIGLEKITIFTDEDRKKTMVELSNLIGMSEAEQEFAEKNIEMWQAQMVRPEDIDPMDQNLRSSRLLYEAYEEKKKEHNYIDFNDCLLLIVRLFRSRPDIHQKYARQFRYVSIDECQDLNNVQFELVTLFSAFHGNFMMVGDDYQSVYAFRGANVMNMINIRNYFPNIQMLFMAQNYRSSGAIIAASNALISHNQGQLQKQCFTEQFVGDAICLYEADDEGREADEIAKIINTMVRMEGYAYKDFAVVYRSNSQSRLLQLSLAQAGVPHKTLRGADFYDRAEIKNVIYYLRAIFNKNDSIAYQQTINSPKRGLAATAVARIESYALESRMMFSDAMAQYEYIPKLTKAHIRGISEYLQLIQDMRKVAETAPMHVIINELILRAGLIKQYDHEKLADQTRILNLEELRNMAHQWDKTNESNDNMIERFLTETSLMSQSDDEVDGNQVTLMTVHSSKGLEFPVVIVPGLEEGTFPHKRSMTEQEIEEERRLMYVAMTRPQRRLILTYSKQKIAFGNKTKPQRSRFIEEIPPNLIFKIGNPSNKY